MIFLRYPLFGILISWLLSSPRQAHAQHANADNRDKKLALGILIGQVRDDPSVGVEFLSPALLTKYVRAHVQLDRTWLEAYKAACDHAAAYTSASTGLMFTTRLSNQVQGIGEAGSFVVSGNRKFSKHHLWPGYYAACGVELYSLDAAQRQLAFVLSAGYAATRARAVRMEGQPSYGNGVFFRAGLRYYF
jgi:hypothetical protein